MTKIDLQVCKDILFGVTVGDAIGVPVEFQSREQLRDSPVTNMRGYGSYNMPPGTFSDDGSLTLCLAEALTNGFDLSNIAQNFINWRYDNYWTATGVMFDIGMTTRRSIERLLKGTQPYIAGDFESSNNGNGSLMRILPLILYTHNKPVEERFRVTRQVSAMTHGHLRSVLSCFYYLEFALCLINGDDKFTAFAHSQTIVIDYLSKTTINPEEIKLFDRLLTSDIKLLSEDKIYSSGYVLHTLEASIWCLLNTENYRDAVLKAVNLGEDTDTTAAVTGGLAALLYGYESIPGDWMNTLARKTDIEDLAERMFKKLG